MTHTCGITSPDSITSPSSIVCWGRTLFGDGSTSLTESYQGITVSTGSISDTFEQLVGIQAATCGRTTQGDVYCWGYPTYGQLGAGNNDYQYIPNLVVGGYTFEEISSTGNGNHVCGITNSDEMYCWGANAMGQFGTGSASSNESTPIKSTNY